MRPELHELVPSGAQTYSKVRGWPANAPSKVVGAAGAMLACDDGDAYVDCTAALGAVLLGHRWGAVETELGPIENAVVRQLIKGVSVSLPTDGEHELAWRLIQLVPGAEMCRFGKNGNDVVNAAVRLARAHTGRSHILRTCYHGHADWAIEYPMSAGVPDAYLNLTHRIQPNDLDDLERHLKYLEVAAFVMEPIPTHDPVIPTDEYMKGVRELCDTYGAVWVMDEMVTGFRAGFPGAVANYSVHPDLWCGAKALGGGLPLTAILGSREIMNRLDQDVFYSTTFAGECVSIASALETLEQLEQVDALAKVTQIGNHINTVYAVHAMTSGLEHETQVIGYPARPVFRWRDDALKAVFLETMCEHGVLCQGYINVMVAHGQVIKRIDRAIAAGMREVASRLTADAEVRVG